MCESCPPNEWSCFYTCGGTTSPAWSLAKSIGRDYSNVLQMCRALAAALLDTSGVVVRADYDAIRNKNRHLKTVQFRASEFMR